MFGIHALLIFLGVLLLSSGFALAQDEEEATSSFTTITTMVTVHISPSQATSLLPGPQEGVGNGGTGAGYGGPPGGYSGSGGAAGGGGGGGGNGIPPSGSQRGMWPGWGGGDDKHDGMPSPTGKHGGRPRPPPWGWGPPPFPPPFPGGRAPVATVTTTPSTPAPTSAASIQASSPGHRLRPPLAGLYKIFLRERRR